jgi:hypothetical protein
MSAEALFSDFGILCGVPVNQEVAFAGANGPRCRQRSVLRRRYIADRVRYNRRVGAKFSLSPLWHGILVNANPATADECEDRITPLAGIATAQNASQISSHTSFRDAEAEFLEFTVLSTPPSYRFVKSRRDSKADASFLVKMLVVAG